MYVYMLFVVFDVCLSLSLSLISVSISIFPSINLIDCIMENKEGCF